MKTFVKYNGRPRAVMSFMGKSILSGKEEEVDCESLKSLSRNLRIQMLFDSGTLEVRYEEEKEPAKEPVKKEAKEEPKKKD